MHNTEALPVPTLVNTLLYISLLKISLRLWKMKKKRVRKHYEVNRGPVDIQTRQGCQVKKRAELLTDADNVTRR